MELKTKNWVYLSVALAGVFILLLGAWWLYLVINLGGQVNIENVGHDQVRLINMVKWEGITFFTLLVGFIFSLIYIFIQDKRKTHSMQAFFASMTHELKTPLASIKLQSDFITDLLEDETIDFDQIRVLLKRLNEDGQKLENQLDRTLQLARVEQGGNLNLRAIELENFIQQIAKKYHALNINYAIPDGLEVMADDFSLSLILKNLFENTCIHNKEAQYINITASVDQGLVSLEYSDGGKNFDGDLKLLGTLFYKHKSPKGTGIGLYLVRKLMLSMKGKFQIEKSPELTFRMIFQPNIEAKS